MLPLCLFITQAIFLFAKPGETGSWNDIGESETQTCVAVGASFIYEVSVGKSHEYSQELLCIHQGYFSPLEPKASYLAGKFSHIPVCISVYYMYDFLVCPALFIFFLKDRYIQVLVGKICMF